MPCAITCGNELDYVAITSNEEVSGHPQLPQLIEIGMRVAIEPVTEQVGDERTTKLTGRQADVVNYQQVDTGIRWTRIEIR
jgi:hypothetical protein